MPWSQWSWEETTLAQLVEALFSNALAVPYRNAVALTRCLLWRRVRWNGRWRRRAYEVEVELEG